MLTLLEIDIYKRYLLLSLGLQREEKPIFFGVGSIEKYFQVAKTLGGFRFGQLFLPGENTYCHYADHETL